MKNGSFKIDGCTWAMVLVDAPQCRGGKLERKTKAARTQVPQKPEGTGSLTNVEIRPVSLSLSFIPVNATSNPLTELEPLGQLSTVSVHLIISALITGKLE